MHRLRVFRLLFDLALAALALNPLSALADVYKALYSFPQTSAYARPPVQAPNGDFYGTTIESVINGVGGCGTAYRMKPSGATTIIHYFKEEVDGCSPSQLVRAADGNYYGTLSNKTAFKPDTLFRMNSAGTVWNIGTFTPAKDGMVQAPSGGLIQGSDGFLYGTTYYGGAHEWGSVFRATLAGDIQTIFDFSNPSVWGTHAVIEAPDGKLYGTTSHGGSLNTGTIFSLERDGSGFEILFDQFGYLGDENPSSRLLRAKNGKFYGLTEDEVGNGVIFAYGSATGYQVLHTFNGTNGTRCCLSPLIQHANGFIYGAAEEGGANDKGVIFRMAPGGTYSVRHTFGSAGTGGQFPVGVMSGRDGNLYGTTALGGKWNGGTAFRLTPE